MQTPNSLTEREMNVETTKLLKALLLKNVQLDITTYPKELISILDDYPSYVRNLDDGSCVVGLPYVFYNNEQLAVTKEMLGILGIPESELIFHAKKHYDEALDELLDALEKPSEKNEEKKEKIMIDKPIYFGSRDDALTALMDLRAYIAKHGSISVGEMLPLVGHASTDKEEFKYGWKDLGAAYVKYEDCCYTIKFPEAERLYSGRYPMD